MADIGTAYATVAELEARLGTTDDGTYTSVLAAATSHVNAFCGREFNQASAATARRFRALDCERLRVDDFWKTDDLAVVVDGTAWALTDVDPRPWDGIVNGEPGWPYMDLFSVDRYWPLWRFRRATIEVTAWWGWAAVPAAIVQATLDVAEVMVLSAAAGQAGVISSERIAGGGADYSVSYAMPQIGSGRDVPPELRKAAPYRRKRFGVA